ncbi:hypothetical protein, partial [uncultured Akkermansia sp.]|uniref:hypothetical protein n=1 Tax=uncultured Akkermansia sp. TaxID=512294 RepID=UPI002617F712
FYLTAVSDVAPTFGFSIRSMNRLRGEIPCTISPAASNHHFDVYHNLFILKRLYFYQQGVEKISLSKKQ